MINADWFTEPDNMNEGTAMSFRIKQKLHEEQSAWQRITIYETETFGNLMTIDEIIMLSTRDNFFYHEMMSHPALFTHQNPKNVVIIGGGDCGTLKEVLKHDSVQKVTQVEIDERVTRVSEQFFPELCESNHDPRATLLFDDGIKYMQSAEDNSLDVIIVDSTDPVGPAEGLFNTAFYQQCRRTLRDDGILVQQTESPLLHVDILQDTQQSMRDGGFVNTQTVLFPQAVYPSGWWSASMAGNIDLKQFRRDTQINGSKYYSADIHAAALTLPPYLNTALKTS